MEERTTLRDVPSGKIELVFNGLASRLQFNCSCMDALPVCKALCCRLRQMFTVILRKEEIGKFESRPFPHSPQLQILQNKEDGSCVYLTDASLCAVHQDKPLSCSIYHCSPGGVGEGILHRDGGWLLSPWKLKEVVDDEGTLFDLEGLRVSK